MKEPQSRKMKKTRAVLAGTACSMLYAPFLFAQTMPKDVNDLLNKISDFVIDPIIFTLFTVAFVVFIWGLVQFVGHLDNEEARSTGQKHMIYGLIGMAIMISVNGLIGIIQKTIQQFGS